MPLDDITGKTHTFPLWHYLSKIWHNQMLLCCSRIMILSKHLNNDIMWIFYISKSVQLLSDVQSLLTFIWYHANKCSSTLILGGIVTVGEGRSLMAARRLTDIAFLLLIFVTIDGCEITYNNCFYICCHLVWLLLSFW